MIPYQPKSASKRNEPTAETPDSNAQGKTCEDGTQLSTPKQLLDYCMKHGDDSELPPDPNRLDRLNWLKDAWTNMSVDLVTKLKESLDVLQSHANRSLSEEEVERVLEAFSNIEMICEDLDFANDFFRVGAGPLLSPYMTSSNSDIRFTTCNLLATLAQHNAFAQSEIIEKCQLIPVLFNALVNDPSGNVRLKALYAISALTRENKAGVIEFVKHDGFVKLAAAIREQTVALSSAGERTSATSTAQKLILKSTFLINNVVNSDALTFQAAPDYVALCTQLAATYRHLVKSCATSAVSLVPTTDEEDATMLSVCESVANCLLTLAKRGGRPAVESLRDESVDFDATLAERIKHLHATHASNANEPSREEFEYATELRMLIADVGSRQSDALAACE